VAPDVEAGPLLTGERRLATIFVTGAGAHGDCNVGAGSQALVGRDDGGFELTRQLPSSDLGAQVGEGAGFLEHAFDAVPVGLRRDHETSRDLEPQPVHSCQVKALPSD